MKENVRRNSLIRKAKALKDQQMKFDHDSSIKELPDFEVGQLVLLATPRHYLNSKTSKKGKVLNSGPFYIAELMGSTALLCDTNGQVLGDLVSLRRLRPIPGFKKNFPVDLIDKSTSGPTIEPAVKTNIVGNIQLSERRRLKQGKVCRLVFPFQIKQAGVWIPEEEIAAL